jgi:hypothetical protein
MTGKLAKEFEKFIDRVQKETDQGFYSDVQAKFIILQRKNDLLSSQRMKKAKQALDYRPVKKDIWV